MAENNDGFFGKIFGPGEKPAEPVRPAAPAGAAPPPGPPPGTPSPRVPAPVRPAVPGMPAPGAPAQPTVPRPTGFPQPGAAAPPNPGAPARPAAPGQPASPMPPASTGIPAPAPAQARPAPAPVSAQPPAMASTGIPKPGTPLATRSRELDVSVNDLLGLIVEKGGSDLHLSVGSPPLMRLQGKLWPTDLPKLTPKDTQRLCFEFISNEQREKFENTLELDMSYEIPGLARFRCNLFWNRLGIGAVFRVIPTHILTLADLKMPPIIQDLARRNKGLILVTGPTGSGKSTTLAAILDLINGERQDHILTIEDPIEFVHQHKNCLVNQREIGPNTKSFANALRAALREDPDVILVGEMRDYETISLAVTAAETGHLVLATLHTPSAAQSVDRIVDVFPAHQQDQIRTQLADALQGIVAQQLIPTFDGRGRAVAIEILVNVPAVANLIRENKTFQLTSILQTSKQLGMQTMDQSLMDLMKQRRISPEEAYRRCFDKKAFEQYKPRSM